MRSTMTRPAQESLFTKRNKISNETTKRKNPTPTPPYTEIFKRNIALPKITHKNNNLEHFYS